MPPSTDPRPFLRWLRGQTTQTLSSFQPGTSRFAQVKPTVAQKAKVVRPPVP